MAAQVPLPSLTDAIEPLAESLDALTHEERLNFVRGLGRREQKALWELAEGRSVGFDYFVDGPGETVIHWGQNSLPAFTSFQKRFHRRTDGAERDIQGYNHNTGLAAAFGGPGHYTLVEIGGTTAIDYTVMPPDVPEGFPALVDNDGGTRQLVYGGMQDHMRRVSKHVTIGRAYKKGKAMGAWFILVREGDPPDAETYAADLQARGGEVPAGDAGSDPDAVETVVPS